MINELSTKHWILNVGDFDLDQMLFENIYKVDPLIQNFNRFKRSQYSTDIHSVGNRFVSPNKITESHNF